MHLENIMAYYHDIPCTIHCSRPKVNNLGLVTVHSYIQYSLGESWINHELEEEQVFFLLILVLLHVLNKNQPDTALAPLGNFCYE